MKTAVTIVCLISNVLAWQGPAWSFDRMSGSSNRDSAVIDSTEGQVPSSAALLAAGVQRYLTASHSQNRQSITQLLQTLADQELPAKARWTAADALGEMGAQAKIAFTPMILLMHGDPDFTVRTNIALALIKIDCDAAVPQLLEGLNSADSDVRQLSAAALCSAGTAAVPSLVKALHCPDPTIRRLSALALGEMGKSANSAVFALRQVACDNDPYALFADQARKSADLIDRLNQASTTEAPIQAAAPFNAEAWLSEDLGQRFRMAQELVKNGRLLGLPRPN